MQKYQVYFFLLLLQILTFSCSIIDNDKASDFKRYQFNPANETKVDSLLHLLSLDEKIAMLHGDGTFVSKGVPRMGIPDLYSTDGPAGIRKEMERNTWKSLELTTDSVTFFPTGTALAATWNTDLAQKYGEGLGKEARARGKDIILGPAVNIIRTPLCGRAFEYFTEDPYLNSEIAVGYIIGVQNQDVAACIKHFAANNQEFERGNIDVVMDERTLREIYLPVYYAAVKKADVRTAMGAYNKFRGHYLCQNDYLNNQILKNQFGFKGILISDWGATHNTMEAALGGLDIEMGTKGPDYNQNFMGYPLRDSVLSGKVPMAVIDDKVRRILRVMLACHTTDSHRLKGEQSTPGISKIAYDVASESIVLLKNSQGLLPFSIDSIKTLAVIGKNANQIQSSGGFTADVKARYEITPLQGLKNKVGDRIDIQYADGYDFEFEKVIVPGNKVPYPLYNANKKLIAEAVAIAESADAVVILAGNSRAIETEGQDRISLQLPFGQDELIAEVSKVNPNTVVVVVAGSAVDLSVATKNVSSIIYSWFNGSEAGTALADVLFGDVNPSGKLPITLPVKINDISAHALQAYPGKDLQVEYKEGILVGYRWFDTKNIEPLYPFGHGLSYTNFRYSGLASDKPMYKKGEKMLISVSVSNTGLCEGKEVVQCYVAKTSEKVERANKELKAFTKIKLQPGSSEVAMLEIQVNDLSYFDTTKMDWVLEPGDYTLLVGSSSRDIRDKITFSIDN